MDKQNIRLLLGVYKGLFLREAVGRFFSSRAAWFWLLLEPIFHIAYMLVVFTVIRVRHIGGMETVVWLALGFLGYFVFNRTWSQVANALSANKALFTYRQVKPIDACFVRGFLEFFIMALVGLVLFGLIAIAGYTVIPHYFGEVFLAFIGLWLLGVGMGLFESVLKILIPEASKILDFLTTPIYFASGIVIPIASIPQPYQTWLMFNPIAHGVELLRVGFSSYYHAVEGVSLGYLYSWVLSLLLLGLVLYRRFALKLLAS